MKFLCLYKPSKSEGTRPTPRWQTPRASVETEDAGNVQSDTVHAPAGCNVESLAVPVAPRHIADSLWNLDGSDVLALRGNDPNASGTRAVDISLLVDPQTVRPAHRRVRGGVEEESPLSDRSVGLHPIAHPEVSSRFCDIQELFVRGKGQPVGPGEILDDQLQLVAVWRGAGLLLEGTR